MLAFWFRYEINLDHSIILLSREITLFISLPMYLPIHSELLLSLRLQHLEMIIKSVPQIS